MIPIKVPPLGESIVEATVSRWLKGEGDAVAAGETLVELETDKINVEVPAQKAGVLAKRSKNEGDVVKVDELLGELDETRARASEAAAAPPAAPPPAEAAKTSPAARRVAAEKGVEVGSVTGTGRGGVVSKPDVLDAKPTPNAATTA